MTAAYGADGWTAEHQAAVQAHGIRRVLIAYDRDAAGDAGAKALARQLMPAGVECFRVEFPPGADVNDIAVDARNPTDVLGRFLRKAAWMGAGPAPRPSTLTPAGPLVSLAAPLGSATLDPAAGEPAGAEQSATATDPLPVPAEPTEPAAVVEPGLASPRPRPPTPGPVASVSERELMLTFGDRRWRVRGLEKATSFDLLRVKRTSSTGTSSRCVSPVT